MKTYFVVWEINIDAESAEDAARQALAIQRDPNSQALVFEVEEYKANEQVTIDLEGKL